MDLRGEFYRPVRSCKCTDSFSFADTYTVNTKGWFDYIISHGSLTVQDKAPFSFDSGQWLVKGDTAASMQVQFFLQQSQVLWLQHEKGGKIAIYLAAKLFQNYLPPHMESKLIIGQIR